MCMTYHEGTDIRKGKGVQQRCRFHVVSSKGIITCLLVGWTGFYLHCHTPECIVAMYSWAFATAAVRKCTSRYDPKASIMQCHPVLLRAQACCLLLLCRHLPLAVNYFGSSQSFCRALRYWCRTPGPHITALAQSHHPQANCFKLSDTVLAPRYRKWCRKEAGRNCIDTVFSCSSIDCACETEIFKHLGLSYVPPHMRWENSSGVGITRPFSAAAFRRKTA